MEKVIRLNAEQRDDLVAYLDGELPDEKVIEIDKVIARSEVARHEVEALARTFELLDALPPVPAPTEFVSKTLTNLKAMEQPFLLADQWWFAYVIRAGVMLLWIAALLLSGWCGFQLTHRWIASPSEAVLAELPLIENLHLYREVGDIEFLKALNQSALFEDAQEK